jgi:hypothetical protein
VWEVEFGPRNPDCASGILNLSRGELTVTELLHAAARLLASQRTNDVVCTAVISPAIQNTVEAAYYDHFGTRAF